MFRIPVFRLIGRRPFLAVLLMAMMATAPATLVAGEFVPGIEDLPLMAELEAIEGAGYAFDTAGGRLVEAYAGGDASEAAVIDFYARTLPELGWEAEDGPGDASEDASGEALRWRREGETLAIDFVEGESPLTVRFRLAPQ